MEKIMLYIVGGFFLLGIVDYIIGGRFNLYKGIENGIKSMGSLALSMIGIFSITPIISDIIIKYILPIFKNSFINPSVIISSFIAVDMGGYKITEAIANNHNMMYFSGILIASMLGCTMSFTVPLALGIINRNNIDIFCKGILCGIIALPIGLFIGGVLLQINLYNIIISILPIIIISIIISIVLNKAPNAMISFFKYIAKIIVMIGVIGLGLQGFTSITGIEIVENLLPLEEILTIVGKIAIFLGGANVMLEVIGRVLKKEISMLGNVLHINSISVTSLIGSLASAVIIFTNFDELDDRGKLICSAFSVGGAYVFGGQLGYVSIEAKEVILIYILVKLISGIIGVIIAIKLNNKGLSHRNSN